MDETATLRVKTQEAVTYNYIPEIIEEKYVGEMYIRE